MRSQPSAIVSSVASGLRQYSLKTCGPLHRISPSSAILISTPGSARPDGAELEVIERPDGADAGRLGHAPALEHRNAGGVEELEDLGRDRRGAADRLADLSAEQVADALEDLLVGLLELLGELGGHFLAALRGACAPRRPA